VKLLDTHILLSALGQVDLVLPLAMQNELQGDLSAAVSVASIWEIAIKHRTGKLRLSLAIENLQKLILTQNIGIVDIKVAHAIADIGPEPVTKDPFDRLLLGVCAAESMKLLTIDRALVDHPLAWREKQGI
jgi:PIN domain nuclease of toxin-antitoxin system